MVTSGELVTSGEGLQTYFHPNPSPAVEIKQSLSLIFHFLEKKFWFLTSEAKRKQSQLGEYMPSTKFKEAATVIIIRGAVVRGE